MKKAKNNGKNRYKEYDYEKESRKFFVIALYCVFALIWLASLYFKAKSFTQVGFYSHIFWLVLLAGLVESFVNSVSDGKNRKAVKKWSPAVFVGLVGLVIVFLGGVFSGPMFFAKAYSEIAQIEESSDYSVIPTIDDINNISLMDSSSARKLGNRQLGKMEDLVSQYEVSDTYYTISYQGKIVKVAPLEYGGFFKWYDNQSIPGYVIVDPTDNTAEYVKIDGGMKYSPSAYLDDNLLRYVQLNNLGKKFYTDEDTTASGASVTGYSFQLDEEGTPYWVVPTYEYAVGIRYKSINGAVLVNASSGEMTCYDSADLPEWVDLVYCGPVIADLYNNHGRYLNGYFNFSESGETMVTDDFGYLMIGDDIYIYTGVTSYAGDQSNVAFIIGNTRTGEITYFAEDGAEEYSAMAACEGVVTNYGYEASFPSLVTVDGEPTYVMVLKDDAGLIKRYGMVNMKNYAIVVVDESLDKTLAKYRKRMAGGDSADETEDVSGSADLENLDEIYITDIKYTTENDLVYATIYFSDGTEETYPVVE